MKQVRVSQIGEEIKRVISQLLRTKIKDPRISDMVSITEVRVTNDLSFAKVFVSVFGTEDEKNDTLEGLRNAEGFIKKEIGRNVKMRIMPKLIFELDDSVEESLRLEKILEEIKIKEEPVEDEDE